ncbi:MAG: type II toxin-antitoxin system VapC family toxin [Alphaproteobacteria bacterium]|nr:type II toxin-antitoxin system VapC family toxin [Alphaproteobacteria bacterium]MBL7097871.1 type II toxin-antitoxin system VapC family toxin [Alphaproteobacteria bacterium]
MIIVDTSVLLDVVTNDPVWGIRARLALDNASATDDVVINDVIYAELSVRYPTIEGFEAMLKSVPLQHRPIPPRALFLAGKAYQLYRRRGGMKTSVLPDFFIGAHAAVEGAQILTRDPGRVKTHFPTVTLNAP